MEGRGNGSVGRSGPRTSKPTWTQSPTCSIYDKTGEGMATSTRVLHESAKRVLLAETPKLRKAFSTSFSSTTALSPLRRYFLCLLGQFLPCYLSKTLPQLLQ